MHAALVSAQAFTAIHAMRQESGVSRWLTLYCSEVAHWAMQQLYLPVWPLFWLHMSQMKLRDHCTPVLYTKRKKSTPNGLLAHGVYSSERLATYECWMH